VRPEGLIDQAGKPRSQEQTQQQDAKRAGRQDELALLLDDLKRFIRERAPNQSKYLIPGIALFQKPIQRLGGFRWFAKVVFID
jgi:hypothetical protein